MNKNSLFEFIKKHLAPGFVYPLGLFVFFFVLYLQSFTLAPISDKYFFANDIEIGRAIRWAEPGHLFWRPLGWLIYNLSQTFGYTGRAVTILQFESAFFGAIGISGFFYLVYTLVKDTRVALFSALMLALSHSYWVRSGDGDSHLVSTSIMIFTLISLFKLPEFCAKNSTNLLFLKCGQETLSVLAISLISALSALFWLPQVLCFPAIALGIVLIPQRLDYRRRLALTLIYLFGLLLFLIAPLLLGLLLINGCKSLGDLVIAIRSTSHSMPLQVNVLSFFRIIYNVANTFVAIPDMGATVKGLITGDFNLAGTNLILEGGKFLAVWAACLLTISYIVIKWKVIEKNLKNALLILGMWISTFFFFGFCGPADLGRMLPALPAEILVASIAISHINNSFRKVMKPMSWETGFYPLKLKLWKTIFIAIPLVLFTWNLSGSLISARNIVNDKDWKMAKSLGQKMNPNDLVITWGHDMSGVSQFLFYYANRNCTCLNLDIVLNGSTGWDERLAKTIKNSLTNGGKVFIHNRLITEKDVPESRWSEKEFPHPSRQELRTFFSQYRKTLACIIEDEVFWEITKMSYLTETLNK